MTPQAAIDLLGMAVMTAIKMSAPLLITTVCVGILVNIIQTVTSIRDMSLIFIPKITAALVVLSLTMPWMIGTMTSFFRQMYSLFGMFTY